MHKNRREFIPALYPKIAFILLYIGRFIIVFFGLSQLSIIVTVICCANEFQNSNKIVGVEEEVVEQLVKQWAPIVWLAPEEKFMPLGVEDFLQNVHVIEKDKKTIDIPTGDSSRKTYMVTNTELDDLIQNKSSFIYGRNPAQYPVPIYAVVTLCTSRTSSASYNVSVASYVPLWNRHISSEEEKTKVHRTLREETLFSRIKRDNKFESTSPTTKDNQITNATFDYSVSSENHANEFIANLADNVRFTKKIQDIRENEIFKSNNGAADKKRRQLINQFFVTYWMFYPYSQGKSMCTLSLGLLGSIPFPTVYGFCLGDRKDIGSHIGDWEHMSLNFKGTKEPDAMYVSAHDAGAYYSYNNLTGSFEFKKQETRKGILQRPNFPKTVTTYINHPVLFAAKGSHGLWTAPGKHRFVKLARLYDINGFGTAWKTWKSIKISYDNIKAKESLFKPSWLFFKGKWGNPKSKCHPLKRIGLNFCEHTDGPTGIPLKEPHFQCFASST